MENRRTYSQECRYPRPYGRGTVKIQAALVRFPAPLDPGYTAG